MSVDSPRTLHVSLSHLSGTKKGRIERFTGDRISIGRGRNNHCCFDPELERTVSARHCEVRLEGIEPFLYDTGSLNGTYLNGKRVRRVPLVDGDEIGLGREGPRLRFLIHSGATPDPIRPGDIIPGPRPFLGTTREELVDEDGSPVARSASRPLPVRTIAIVALVLAAVALGVGLGLGQRESGGTAGVSKETDGAMEAEGTTAIAAVPAGVRGATVLVVAVPASGDSARMITIGAGALIAPDCAIAPAGVVTALREVLGRRTSDGVTLRAAVLPGGVAAARRFVRAAVVKPDPETSTETELAALLLEPDPAAHAVFQAVADIDAESLAISEPHLALRDVRVLAWLDDGRSPVERAVQAVLLRYVGSGEMAGLPLAISGKDALVGLVLGPRYPGLAIGPRAIADFVQGMSRVPPTPLP